MAGDTTMSERWRAVATIATVATASCLQPPEHAPPTAVVGLAPDRPVAVDEPAELIFSNPVEPTIEILAVEDLDGGPVDARIVAMDSVWRLQPQPRWPAGRLVQVRARADLVDGRGRKVGWPEEPLIFEVAPDSPTARPAVRWPTPGTSAPSHTRWLALQAAPESLVTVRLETEGDDIEGLRRETVDGVTRFELQPAACVGLCPGQTYRLNLADAAPGIRSQVVTATSTDGRPPEFTVAEVDARPGEVEVRWACDEPVFLRARLLGPDLSLEAVVGLGRAGIWRYPVTLTPGATYDLTATATDLTNQRTVGIERRLVGPAPVRVSISEIVATPRSDWGDSDPRGLPFDASPGQGTVSTADEWIELVNQSEASVDIEAAGLRVLTLDRTPAETIVATAAALYFGDGGVPGDWRPGEAVVVRPRGDMTQSDLTIEVWAGALLLERVVLGDGPDAEHPGGGPPDLTREALARSPDGRWQWCRPTPGDPRPNTDCGR